VLLRWGTFKGLFATETAEGHGKNRKKSKRKQRDKRCSGMRSLLTGFVGVCLRFIGNWGLVNFTFPKATIKRIVF
jgi:hypothetical protein